jgi:hypothetical protein
MTGLPDTGELSKLMRLPPSKACLGGILMQRPSAEEFHNHLVISNLSLTL